MLVGYDIDTCFIVFRVQDNNCITNIFVFSPRKTTPMPTTRTYSPLPPMIPAGDIFWTNPCILREPAPCPHTYGVRVCSCDAFATEPCRPTACISAAPFRHTPYSFRPRPTTVWRNLQQHPQCADATTTLHSPFSILNSSFSHTFSAKERDSETGLSYFGARYYSSDLSIWLSVDPQAAKYPSLSPYVYCADNPIKLVDPNGEDIVPYGLLLYYGLEKGGRERSHESIKVGIYTVTPFYDNNNQLIGYNAVREYQQNGKTFWRAEYQMDPSDLQAFKDNVKYYERCANMIYAYGEPDWRIVALGDNLIKGQLGNSLNILGTIWKDALRSPEFWLSIAFSAGYSSLSISTKSDAIVSEVLKGEKNFGLGSATLSEANLAGAKWVGKGARLSSSGTAWISADGTRQYRPPTVKKKSGRYQANFESRSGNTGPWENNGHLDIQ